MGHKMPIVLRYVNKIVLLDYGFTVSRKEELCPGLPGIHTNERFELAVSLN